MTPLPSGNRNESTVRCCGVAHPSLLGELATRWNQKRQKLSIVLALGLVAICVSAWQLTLPEFLSYYDTGVYVGAAIHFVNGTLPYARFTFVEPPGIVLILSPVALLSHFIGDSGALEAARLLSVVISGINVAILAWLLRSRGRIAMMAAGLTLSSIPVAAYVDASVKLELYCVMFSLMSALVAFAGSDDGTPLTRRRVIVAGLLMGTAILIKFFAIFPLAAAFIIITRCSWRRASEFIAAAAGIFVLVSAPFFAISPRNFISQVFVDQIIRRGTPAADVGAIFRLKMLTGFAYSAHQPSSAVTVVVITLAGVVLLAAALRRSRTTALDDFLALSAILLALGLMIPDHSAIYYYYVPAPFLIGAVVTSIARIAPRHVGEFVRANLRRRSQLVVRIATAATAIGVAVGCLLWSTTVDQAEAWSFGVQSSWPNVLKHQIPAGACVIYSQTYYALAADRFATAKSRCPAEVDTYGMWLAWGDNPQHPPPKFVRLWHTNFELATYAVLSYGGSSNVPWTPALRSWFAVHYHLIHTDPGFQVFLHTSERFS